MEEAAYHKLMAIADRCIRERAPLYDLAQLIADVRGDSVAVVLFGPCKNEGDTRRALKTAEMHAKRPYRWNDEG